MQTKLDENRVESEIQQSIDLQELQRSLELLGVNLTELELNELYFQKIVSLEGKSLSEIGSLFILASALSKSYYNKKNVTFGDLPKSTSEFSLCFGIPICSVNLKSSPDKLHVYLCLIKGKLCLKGTTTAESVCEPINRDMSRE